MVTPFPAHGNRGHSGAGRASARTIDGSRAVERSAGRADGGCPDAPARHLAGAGSAPGPRLRRTRRSRNRTARGTLWRRWRCRQSLIRCCPMSSHSCRWKPVKPCNGPLRNGRPPRTPPRLSGTLTIEIAARHLAGSNPGESRSYPVDRRRRPGAPRRCGLGGRAPRWPARR